MTDPCIVEAAELSTLRARVAELEGALQSLRMGHIVADDPWYSCPKSSEGCANALAGSDCTCGADTHNAKIDNALSAPSGMVPVPIAAILKEPT